MLNYLNQIALLNNPVAAASNSSINNHSATSTYLNVSNKFSKNYY